MNGAMKLLVLIYGILTGQFLVLPASAASCTITADCAVPDTFNYPIGRVLSSVGGQASFGTNTWEHLDALHLELARVWLRFERAYDVTNQATQYDKYDDYISAWSRHADVLLLNWTTSYRLITVTNHLMTEAQLTAASIEMLAHFKKLCPNIQFVECENEPPSTVEGMNDYYPEYRFLYNVVNAVNAMHLPGGTLKIGGPTLNTFSPRGLTNFLDHYVADTNADKRLDFIAYHQYLFGSSSNAPLDNKDNPALVKNERELLDGWLADRKLPALAAYISETGVFPSARKSSLGLAADFHLQAAGMAAMDFYYVNQRGLVPFEWTVDHPSNDRKDMFVDTTNGEPRPYYLMQQMHAMLPGTRFSCTTNLDRRGLGVGALASGTATQVAVMTWNYQWEHTNAYDAALCLVNLPKAFKTRKVRVESYLVETNYDHGDLPKIEDRIHGPLVKGFYRRTDALNPNTLRLVVLTAQ